MDKGVERKNEGYGDWMVVSRHKLPNKTKAKILGLKMSNTAKSSQAPSSNADSRTLGHNKKEGKRKASHLMPREMLKEADETSRSSQGKSGATKSVGDIEANGKTKQKANNLVQSQRVEVGPKQLKESFSFGVNSGCLNISGPSSTPLSFLKPNQPSH